jgi:hypothetical protein
MSIIGMKEKDDSKKWSISLLKDISDPKKLKALSKYYPQRKGLKFPL